MVEQHSQSQASEWHASSVAASPAKLQLKGKIQQCSCVNFENLEEPFHRILLEIFLWENPQLCSFFNKKTCFFFFAFFFFQKYSVSRSKTSARSFWDARQDQAHFQTVSPQMLYTPASTCHSCYNCQHLQLLPLDLIYLCKFRQRKIFVSKPRMLPLVSRDFFFPCWLRFVFILYLEIVSPLKDFVIILYLIWASPPTFFFRLFSDFNSLLFIWAAFILSSRIKIALVL